MNLLRDNVKKSVIPLTKYAKINYESKPNKWYDDEIAQLKDDKWQSRLKWLNCRTNKQLWHDYVIKRNKYNKLIKIKKNTHTENEIKNASKDQRKMWICLNKLVSTKNHSKVSDEIVFPSGKLSEPKQISETFNSYFIESIVNINQSIPIANEITNLERSETNTRFKLRMVNTEIIGNILKDLSKKVNRADLCNANVWFMHLITVVIFSPTL